MGLGSPISEAYLKCKVQIVKYKISGSQKVKLSTLQRQDTAAGPLA